MDPTDFLLLYQELGLRPGSSIDDFKLAYRRRIADLHPDRQRGAGRHNPEAARARLQQLTLQYGAAIAFHRRHGRLPGASAAPRGTEPAAPIVPPPERSSGLRKRGLLALLILALLGLIGWQWFESDDNGFPDGPDESAVPARAPDPVVWAEAAPELHVGMAMREVLEFEPEPITRGEDRWEYGPSWIAFQRGKVSDWYSSPLRPLRYASTHPRPAAVEEPAR